MRAYEGIEVSYSQPIGEKTQIFHRRKQHILSLVFLSLLSFSCMGLSFSGLGLSSEVKTITSYWSPNLAELGKLKYVDGQTDSEVLASISELGMPFSYCYLSELGGGAFEVNGLGSMVVKACLKGKVESVMVSGATRSVIINHGSGLKTQYDELTNVGVREGDGVEKNTPIGISENSRIVFKIIFKDKVLAGLSVSDGEFSFL